MKVMISSRYSEVGRFVEQSVLYTYWNVCLFYIVLSYEVVLNLHCSSGRWSAIKTACSLKFYKFISFVPTEVSLKHRTVSIDVLKVLCYIEFMSCPRV